MPTQKRTLFSTVSLGHFPDRSEMSGIYRQTASIRCLPIAVLMVPLCVFHRMAAFARATTAVAPIHTRQSWNNVSVTGKTGFPFITNLPGTTLRSSAFAWAHQHGVIRGKDNGTLDPLGYATRAELAVMLIRYVNAMES